MLTIREILVNPKYQVSCRKGICRLEINNDPQIIAYCDNDILELQITGIGTVNFDFKDRNIGINMGDNCDEANITDSTEEEQFKIITFVKDNDEIKYNIIIYEITYDMFKFKIEKVHDESEFITDIYVYRTDEDKR